MQAAAGSDSPQSDTDSPLTDLDMSLIDADGSDSSTNTFSSSLTRALNGCSEVSDNGEADDEESDDNESNDNDDDDGSAKPWTPDDAIDRLETEFWEHNPRCEPDDVAPAPDHPQFHL